MAGHMAGVGRILQPSPTGKMAQPAHAVRARQRTLRPQSPRAGWAQWHGYRRRCRGLGVGLSAKRGPMSHQGLTVPGGWAKDSPKWRADGEAAERGQLSGVHRW
jgi:hypothetical protein